MMSPASTARRNRIARANHLRLVDGEGAQCRKAFDRLRRAGMTMIQIAVLLRAGYGAEQASQTIGRAALTDRKVAKALGI